MQAAVKHIAHTQHCEVGVGYVEHGRVLIARASCISTLRGVHTQMLWKALINIDEQARKIVSNVLLGVCYGPHKHRYICVVCQKEVPI